LQCGDVKEKKKELKFLLVWRVAGEATFFSAHKVVALRFEGQGKKYSDQAQSPKI